MFCFRPTRNHGHLQHVLKMLKCFARSAKEGFATFLFYMYRPNLGLTVRRPWWKAESKPAFSSTRTGIYGVAHKMWSYIHVYVDIN